MAVLIRMPEVLANVTEAAIQSWLVGVGDQVSADTPLAEIETEKAMVELLHMYIYPDRDLDKAAPSIINGAMRINAGAALNKGSVVDQLDWFKAEGLIKPGITFDTVVDSSYVPMM